jgi:hypothetical protein
MQKAEHGCPRAAEVKAEPTRLRNEAQLNRVSLLSQLEDEVTCGVVKGQDERPFGAPLTAPRVTTGSIQHGRKLARLHGKTDKRGDAEGRPGCQSLLLSDPNAKFSVEMWRTRSKEGRHVDLDFYDLLIEALKTPP